MLDENHVVDVADQAYLTDMNIYFKEDDLWVLATQHVERWSYSDTGLTPEEAEESVLLVCAGLSSTLTISQLITKSDNLIDTVFQAFSIWQSLLNIGFLRQALKTTSDNISFSSISTSTQRLCCVHTSLIWTIFFLFLDGIIVGAAVTKTTWMLADSLGAADSNNTGLNVRLLIQAALAEHWQLICIVKSCFFLLSFQARTVKFKMI